MASAPARHSLPRSTFYSIAGRAGSVLVWVMNWMGLEAAQGLVRLGLAKRTPSGLPTELKALGRNTVWRCN